MQDRHVSSWRRVSGSTGLRGTGVGLLFVVALGLSGASGAVDGPSSVRIEGPRVVRSGEEVGLTAHGSPAGGTYRWSVTAADSSGTRRSPLGAPAIRSVASGNRMVLTGLSPEDAATRLDVRVSYTHDGSTSTAFLVVDTFVGDLTAHRPQHGSGYFPFEKTEVSEADEVSGTRGPGIRVNGLGDADPAGEDDLIEVELSLEFVPRNLDVVLARQNGNLAVWTTRDKQAGTELAFSGNTSAPLQMGGASTLTLWVEWAGTSPGLADLQLVLQGLGNVTLDRLRFHAFRSIVEALGGEDQVPSIPVDPNHGSYVVGIALYESGYDVHLHDEDSVSPTGTGSVYDEVVDAIQSRGVDRVVLFGYSHGGGSTYDLSDRLDMDRGSIGTFTIPFTSYVDGVENDSDTDIQQELRFPPSSAYHANHYQVGAFLPDFFLDGGPVPGADPPPSGLNVETTPWGSAATHFLVDDYVEVRDFIQTNLELRVDR